MHCTSVGSPDVYLRELEKYLPKMYKCLMNIYQELGSERENEVIKEQYDLIDGISVDFGIMQKTRKAFVVKSEFDWDDIGSFAAISRFLENSNGNNVMGNAFMEESENCTVMCGKRLVIGFGIKDLVIIDTGDVILIMDKNKDQEMKHLVSDLQKRDDLSRYL